MTTSLLSFLTKQINITILVYLWIFVPRFPWTGPARRGLGRHILLKAARGLSPPPPRFGAWQFVTWLALRGQCMWGRCVDAIVDQLILGRFLADPGRLLADSGRSWQIPKYETCFFALGLSGGVGTWEMHAVPKRLNFYIKNHPKSIGVGSKNYKKWAQVDQQSIKNGSRSRTRIWNATGGLRVLSVFTILAPLGRFWCHLSCLRQIPAPGPRKVTVRTDTCFRWGCFRSCAGFLWNWMRKNMAGEETNCEKDVKLRNHFVSNRFYVILVKSDGKNAMKLEN